MYFIILSFHMRRAGSDSIQELDLYASEEPKKVMLLNVMNICVRNRLRYAVLVFHI